MRKFQRYTLVDAITGDPMTMTHQDDMETPLVADTLYRLLDTLGDWCDCGLNYVLENLKGDIFTDVVNGGGRYRIKREVVREVTLGQKQFDIIEKIRQRVRSKD